MTMLFIQVVHTLRHLRIAHDMSALTCCSFSNLCGHLDNTDSRMLASYGLHQTRGASLLQEVADSLQPAGRQLPVFMGGISMGGCLTILTALRSQSAWQVHVASLRTK